MLACPRCGYQQSEASLSRSNNFDAGRNLPKEERRAAAVKRYDRSDKGKVSKRKSKRSVKGKARNKRYKNGVAGKAAALRYRAGVRVEYLGLLHVAFADPDGLCRGCHRSKPNDIDHMREKEIWIDGLPRKKECLSQCISYTELRGEVERNTDQETGEVYLQSLCVPCHITKTHGGKNLPSGLTGQRRAFVNAHKRALAVCAYPECDHPEDVCTAGIEAAFHMDHLHPPRCTCAICAADPSLRKVACVSAMVYRAKQWSQEALVAEISPAKTRMIHAGCHIKHTSAQWAAGMWSRVQEQVAEQMDAEELVAIEEGNEGGDEEEEEEGGGGGANDDGGENQGEDGEENQGENGEENQGDDGGGEDGDHENEEDGNDNNEEDDD
jgi:hypothetical protein